MERSYKYPERLYWIYRETLSGKLVGISKPNPKITDRWSVIPIVYTNLYYTSLFNQRTDMYFDSDDECIAYFMPELV